MAALTRKFISKLTTAYRTINPSTLNGSIDVIVVKQEDGTLRCTPFHVRFGKLGVLHSAKHRVYITINDNSVDSIYMQLGEAGEAFFVEENSNTPTIQLIRHSETCDGNTFLDPDNMITLSPETSSQKHLSAIACSPQIINKQNDENQQPNHDKSQTTPDTSSYEQESKTTLNIDVIHSNTIVSTRRRTKRRIFNRSDQFTRQISEDDDQDFNKQFFLLKHRSRARKRDSTPIVTDQKLALRMSMNDNDKLPIGVKLLRKRSASENDLPFFQFDIDTTPFVDAHSRFNSIDSRPKTLNLNDPDNVQQFRLEDEEILERKTTRAISNPIIIEQMYEPIKPVEDTSILNNSILSKSAPSDTIATNNILIGDLNDHKNDFSSHEEYSPTSSYESALSPRPTSPKSDTEYELDKPSQQSANIGWQWKWGELPEQRGVFNYFWSSSTSKKDTPKEGLYLDEIENNQSIDRSQYLPQLVCHRNQVRTSNDDDQESGTGNSIPQSPFREHETSCLLGDIQLSLCGNINKQALITDEDFNKHLISFEIFANNPTLINDPNLVVRINRKYYNWNVASVLMTAAIVFHKQLPTETIEQLQEKCVPQTKPRATGGSWWLPFYGKKSDIKNETPKLSTPTNAVNNPTTITKSDIVSSLSVDDKTLKSGNDSEQEDNEVRKLTAKFEQEKVQQQQHSPSTHLSHQTALKKSMILSSDQLQSLNLKLGKNKVEFSVTTALQGTTTVESNIFFFDHMTKFVISDIDGTITKSDVLGHIIPLVGGDWSHDGIAEFFNAIQENGYQFIYLSARAIGQSQITRNFLQNIKQSDQSLPSGPLLISPDTLMTAFYREVIAKKPEDFKIECLKNIASLFPDKNPFYAGFGNRINDQWAYTAVGIPVTRIYTINPRGEVVREKLSQALLTSYKNLHEIVDLLFPPMDSFSASETYSVYTYWHREPAMDRFEEEMKAQLEEISKRQKSGKTTNKTKSTSSSNAATPTTSILPTPTGSKSLNDKPLTISQINDNTAKRA